MMQCEWYNLFAYHTGEYAFHVLKWSIIIYIVQCNSPYLLPWSQRFFLKCEAAKTSREEVRREKLQVTWNLNLTFMHMPAVKCVKLINY